MPNKDELIAALEAHQEAGRLAEAADACARLAAMEPASAEWAERLGLLQVHLAATAEGDAGLPMALENLARALAIDPTRRLAREVRANLLVLMSHRLEDNELMAFAMRDFLQLEATQPDATAEQLGRWRVEAARAAFLSLRNKGEETPDYTLALELFSRVEDGQHEASDWFFRGIAALESGRPADDPAKFRLAAACFLRAVEEGGLDREARYFAADALLSLEDPSTEEFKQAEFLVGELDAFPQRDFLIDALGERLALRRRLLPKQD